MGNKLSGGALSLGDSGTATNNFVMTASAANGTMKLARGNEGATTQDVLTVDAAGKVSLPNNPALFSKYFQSTDQIITAGAQLTLAHGMATIPTLWQVYLKCTAADAGYSAGDILINPGFTGAAGLYGIAFVPDATNLVGRFVNNATTFGGTHKASGAAAGFTSANWVVFVRAWA